VELLSRAVMHADSAEAVRPLVLSGLELTGRMTDSTAETGGPWRIALVDDDATVLRSLSRMLTLCGYEVSTYSSADAFLTSLHEQQPEMLLVDLRMPQTDGLALQQLLFERGVRIPMVFLSGHGDVSTSVRAIRGGAIDFLEKPCDEATLLVSLERAADVARREREKNATLQSLKSRASTLTRREQEVFRWVASGRLNKQIAATLGTTEKTIKVHRGRVMTKMHAESLAELVRMYDLLESSKAPRPVPAGSLNSWRPGVVR